MKQNAAASASMHATTVKTTPASTPSPRSGERAYGLLAALVFFLAPALHAATVEFAGVINNDSGSQITEWRTAGTPKTHDADGDHLYGTTARLLFGVGSFGEGTVFDIVSNDPIVGPFPGYATVDGVNGGADVQVKTTTNNAVPGADRVMFTFTAREGCPSAVRIGVATDGLDYGFVAPASVGLRQVGGSSAEHTLAAGDMSLDMVFFTVSGVKPGDQFQIFGDPSTSDFATIQLVTWDALVVTNANDSSPGSLRAALATAASTVGPDTITFAPGLNGGVISLASQISIADAGGVTVDASVLSAGLTINDGAGTSYGLITLESGTLTLRGLTLADGGGVNLSEGGALRVFSGATATLGRCTLSGNKAGGNTGGFGGAIYNAGTLALSHCTLVGNSASNVGGIGGSGGAIYNFGTVTLTHCTLHGNSATTFGGAISNTGGSTLNLANTIAAGNTCANGPDIDNFGTITPNGVNFIGDTANSGLTANGTTILSTALNGSVNLAPLGSYGGPTQTMPPLPGSPAIDAAVGSAAASDQRGFLIPLDGDANGTATADIGAVEAQTLAGQNFSFENPTLALNVSTGDNPGWTDVFAAPPDAFIEHLASPFRADGNQHLGMNPGA